MSLRYKGGVISATPPTVSTTSAPGVWTLPQQFQYQGAGTWPLSVVPDPYFENVIGLFHFDGTNGAQNNTFLDSSTNAFSITRNGNTTQGSFSPFSRADGYWSNYFNGSTGYLSIANNAALQPGTGDFTIEFWAYNTDTAAAIDMYYASGVSGISIYRTSAGKIEVAQDGIVALLTGATTIVLNQWNHIAVVRSGTTLRIYLNGVQDATTTNSTNFSSAGTQYIGTGSTSSYYWPGYLSNFRIVKGTAVYTAAFTPPTSPLTAIANTSLLTCQSNRFKDNSTNNFTITQNGNVSVQAFGPFNPTTAYTAASNGGSGYFDGSGDYLTVPDNAAFDMGTGDVTIEAWIYVTNIPSATAQGIFGNLNSGYEFYMYPYGAAGTISIGVQTFEGGYQQIYTTTNNVRLNEWTHVAFTRASGTNRFFVNGALCSTTGTLTNPLNAGGTQEIGRRSYNPTDYFYGYMSNLRIVKGTAVYTAAFTPPTAPLTAISGTSLLCNFTNAGAFDSAAIEDYETVGSSQLSTAQFKFGTSSLILNGSTTANANTLRSAAVSSNFQLGAGNFTIEGFLRLTSSAINYPFIWALLRADGINALTMFFGDAGYGYNTLFYVNDGVINTGTGAQSTYLNTWKHFAIVRSGTSTLTYYIDGTSVYSGTLSTDLNVPCRIVFGNYGNGSTYGYLDEFRITKGYARYTANFTPPTAAFPNL